MIALRRRPVSTRRRILAHHAIRVLLRLRPMIQTSLLGSYMRKRASRLATRRARRAYSRIENRSVSGCKHRIKVVPFLGRL